MHLDQQKSLIRKFCDKYGDNFVEEIVDNKCENLNLPFENSASVQLRELSPLEVEINKTNQYKYIPESISNAFELHIWYSQWNFADLFLIKIFIDKKSFFFLFHLGICVDNWDNSNTSLVEIFSERGEFIYGIDFTCHLPNLKLKEEPFSRKYFRNGKTGEPPPPLFVDDSKTSYFCEPLWTEEMLIREGAKIERSSTFVRYLHHWELKLGNLIY